MRQPVAKFAQMMEDTLCEYDETKGTDGWLIDTRGFLVRRLLEEVGELVEAFMYLPIDEDGVRRIVQEAVDVGNFAMMIADKARISWLAGGGKEETNASK